MSQNKPHVYKIEYLWYCKHPSTYREGMGESPESAYRDWLEMICKGY